MANPWIKKTWLYKIECARRAALLFAFNALLPRRRQAEEKTIAFIKRGGIGDWVLFAPVLESIRARFPAPEWVITVFSDPAQVGIIEMIGLCDRIEVIDPRRFRKSFFHRRSFLARIRRAGYSIWFDADIDRTNAGDAMALASAAPIRIAFQGVPHSSQSLVEHRVYTKVLPDPLNTVHMQRRLEVIASALPGGFPLNHEPRQGLRKYLWQGKDSDYFVVSPGSSTPIRSWPIERFVTLCRALHQTTGLRPVLIGGASDAQACTKLAELLAQDMSVENRAGTTTLAGLFELIVNARGLVTNESGPMHIGHATGTPTLAIVSGGDFNSYCSYPASPCFQVVAAEDRSCFNCRWNCIHPVANRDSIRECLASVTSEHAIDTARVLFSAVFPKQFGKAEAKAGLPHPGTDRQE